MATNKWFKTETCLLTVLEAKSLKSKCLWAWLLLETIREDPLHVSLLDFGGFLQSLAFLGWRMHPSDLYLWLPVFFAVRPFLFSSLIRTLVIGFRAHLNSSRSFLKILALVTSAKTLLPNKVTLTGYRWTYLLRSHRSTQMAESWAPCAESACLTSSLEMLMLLDQGPHSEAHCHGQKRHTHVI